MGWLLLVVAILALALGAPVSFAIGMVSVLYIVVHGDFSLTTVPQKIFAGMDSFLLLSIPFFVLAGALMNHGGITRRLVDFAMALVGRIPGGLGQVTVVTNVVMSGMSGTAAADAVATGTVLIPSMIKEGYSRGFAAAISSCAATIGPIIPPSVAFVIFGGLTSVSVGQLFLAGVLPGLLMGVYLMIACYIVARKRGYGRATTSFDLRIVGRTLFSALPAMFAPVVVIGGMVGGIVTTTEAAALAALYSFLLALAYKELRLNELFPMLTEVVVTTSVIYLLLGVFNLVGWVLAVEQIPQAITSFFLQLTDNWIIVLLIINVILLLLGTFMEPVPLMVLLGPPLMPVIQHYGIDPVHFGVIFVLNIVIGVVSPPIGTNMFISCSIARCTVGEFTREVIPFLIALVALLLVVTYVPQISLFLPTLLAR